MTERLVNYEESRRHVAAEIVLFSAEGALEPALQVLLIRRDLEPNVGKWVLPGGPVRPGEGLAGAAAHRLEEVAGVRGVFLHQVAAFGDPDPKNAAVSILHLGLVRRGQHRAPAGRDASVVAWHDVDGRLPPLAHDHGRLIEEARASLSVRLRESPAVFELLPEEFTLGDVQSLCESILGRDLDKRNFRRKLLELGFVVQTRKLRRDGAFRPARLFRFDARRFASWAKRSRAFPFR